MPEQSTILLHSSTNTSLPRYPGPDTWGEVERGVGGRRLGGGQGSGTKGLGGTGGFRWKLTGKEGYLGRRFGLVCGGGTGEPGGGCA